MEVLGLTETCREGNSIYLRTWDDYEHHTVKLTAHETSGIRRVGLRASSQAALEARVAAIEAAGLGVGWKDGDPGIGPTYLFRDPDGHELELYWESEWYTPPDELKPSLKNQAQAYPGRGVCVRRLDHVNYLARDVPPSGDFVRDVLGGRVTEQIMLDDGTISAQWLHFTNKGYDLVYTRDWTGSTGRLHHVAFAPDTREDILRAADICLDHGRVHRDRAAQARDPADVLPLRLRARRQPDRAGQPGRAAGARAGLAHDHLDRGRTGQGPGLGPEDDRVLPHPRDPAGRLGPAEYLFRDALEGAGRAGC